MGKGCQIVSFPPRTKPSDTPGSEAAESANTGDDPPKTHTRPRRDRDTQPRTKRMQIRVDNLDQCSRDLAMWETTIGECRGIVERRTRGETETDKLTLIQDRMERACRATSPAQPRAKVS